MKFFRILPLCFILLNGAAFADALSDWERCVRMNRISFSFDFNFKNKDKIFADYPEFKSAYENFLNTPLREQCGWAYTTGVGCSCQECKVGQKLTECVTPTDYRSECAPIIAFTMMEDIHKDKYIEQELIKKCGPKPDKSAASQSDPKPTTTTKIAEGRLAPGNDSKADQRKIDRNIKSNERLAEKEAARDAQKNSNADVKSFRDDIDAAEKAFKERVRELLEEE